MRCKYALSLSLLAAACADCNRDGCDALASRAEAGEAGVAGIVAVESDVVANGCRECPFGEATIEMWRIEQPVASSEEAMAIVTSAPPSSTIAAAERYRTPLEVGNYLFCVRPSCVNVSVAASLTATVNVQLREGPPSFYQLDSSSDRLVEELGFGTGF